MGQHWLTGLMGRSKPWLVVVLWGCIPIGRDVRRFHLALLILVEIVLHLPRSDILMVD